MEFWGILFLVGFGYLVVVVVLSFSSGTYVSDPPIFMDRGILGAYDKAISGVSMTYLYNVLCCVLCCL